MQENVGNKGATGFSIIIASDWLKTEMNSRAKLRKIDLNVKKFGKNIYQPPRRVCKKNIG